MIDNAAMDCPIESAVAGPPTWSLWRRILFRFAFTYMVLYIVPFPLDGMPYVSVAAGWLQQGWYKAVVWAGDVFLALDITILPNGSGDTTFNYVEVCCYFAIAALATLVWSIVDRRRESYRRLHDWLRIYVRYYLGMRIIGYGIVKVIKIQFADLDLDKLTEPYGEASPMGLLWTFMGFSTGYNLFAGAGEVIGGVLLFWRRTTMLGAIILTGVVGHIVALNFCFDVPVKLFSMHLMLMAVFLLLPDLRRLFNFTIGNKPVQAADLGRPFERKWANITAIVVKYLLVGASLTLMVTGTMEMSQQAKAAPTATLHGLYDVVEFSSDGKVIPPALTEPMRWRRVIINRYGGFTVVLVNDQRQKCYSQDDPDKKTLKLTMRSRPDEMLLTYDAPNKDELVLGGRFLERTISARLRRITAPSFPLMTRGFHWINEYPYHY